jgi:hypothetical protein
MMDRSRSDAGQDDLHAHQTGQKKPAEEIIGPGQWPSPKIIQYASSRNDEHLKLSKVPYDANPQDRLACGFAHERRCSSVRKASGSVVDLYSVELKGSLDHGGVAADAEQAFLWGRCTQKNQR